MATTSYMFDRNKLRYHTVQIANNTTDSDIIQLPAETIVGIIIPVAHSYVTLTLHGSIDGTNFYALKEKDGTAVAITTATTTGFYKLSPSLTDGVPYVKLVSSGLESPQRNITLLVASYK